MVTACLFTGAYMSEVAKSLMGTQARGGACIMLGEHGGLGPQEDGVQEGPGSRWA